MRFRFLALFALIVACGARTGLTDPDSRGGSSAEGGGAVGGGGSPSDGAGGEGGDLPVCATLVLDGPPRSHVDPIPASTRERDASLVAVDDTRVMLFHTLDDDLAEGSDLRAATFDAWGAWPDSLGPARHVMSAVREGSIASNGLSDGAMVLVPLFSLGTPGATLPVVAPSVMPGTDYMDARAQFLFRLSGATRPAAVASADSAMTVWTTRVGEFTYSAFETFCENGPCEGPTFDSGCASSDVRAGTIARDDGFLLAFSSGRDWGTCLLDDGIPGPPTRIQTERRGGPPGVAPGADIVMPEPIAELTMVQRRPEGGWVVVRTDGSTSFQPPPIVGIPVDDAGFAASQPVVLVPEGATVGPIAASAFGDGLAVAWVAASPDPVAPDIGVRVFDRDGNLLAETSLSTSAAFLSPNERLSLIESPSHDALLLGWSSAGAEPKVVAARVACR